MNRRRVWIGLLTACLLGSTATAAESSRPPSSDPHAPVWTSLQGMHSDYVKAFVQSDGFGIRRLTPMMLLMQGGTLVLDRQQLRVEDVQMIGIAKHDPPVVYASGVFKFQHGDEGQVFLRTSDHRPVNAEEQRILDDLQAGHEIVSQAVAGGITSVAAIRAMPNCLQCHQSKREGDTMGAFVYRLRVIQE